MEKQSILDKKIKRTELEKQLGDILGNSRKYVPKEFDLDILISLVKLLNIKKEEIKKDVEGRHNTDANNIICDINNLIVSVLLLSRKTNPFWEATKSQPQKTFGEGDPE